MATGGVQIWPASPVDGPLFEGERVTGVRLVDQGTDLQGNPTDGYTPGMDVHAQLTVVGDGPVGVVGRALDQKLGLPEGHVRDDWALGMKMLVDLREGVELEPGMVLHTVGFPEPEIFGFLYVVAPRTVSLGIFVPSWFRSPVRTAYRYLQHWMMHPFLWRWLEGGTLRSWGAKSVQESGMRGEPHLVGDGFARIGEGSGSTNALTGSGVDEAWTTGVLLAEAVIELCESGEPFTRANLERTYVARRRASWLDSELRLAEGARDGFDKGVIAGMLGMMLAGFTGGRKLRPFGLGKRRQPDAARNGRKPRPDPVLPTDAYMNLRGWPAIPHDGRLLMTHQDALLIGGKVQAAAGYANHVRVRTPELCRLCAARVCVSMCSGQALTSAGPDGIAFDREKCVHCGACLWNCENNNLDVRAGVGGLHSVEN
jgi:electron-transferring-flavoprotein dehydrogenase